MHRERAREDIWQAKEHAKEVSPPPYRQNAYRFKMCPTLCTKPAIVAVSQATVHAKGPILFEMHLYLNCTGV